MTEIWDLVDQNGNKTGVKIPREERDKIPEGQYFPCAEVWVRVGEQLLITRRHESKSEGLKYDLPGGGVLSGESFSAAAVRELYEETGIGAVESHLTYLGGRIFGKAFAVSFLLRLDALPPLKLQPLEVVGYQIVDKASLEEMKNELTEGTYRRFCLYKDQVFA